jgi:hypothetical protein
MDPRKDVEGLKMADVDDEIAQDAGFEEEDEEFEEEDRDEEAPNSGRDTERELDHGLKETFPASDPVSINPGAD